MPCCAHFIAHSMAWHVATLHSAEPLVFGFTCSLFSTSLQKLSLLNLLKLAVHPFNVQKHTKFECTFYESNSCCSGIVLTRETWFRCRPRQPHFTGGEMLEAHVVCNFSAPKEPRVIEVISLCNSGLSTLHSLRLNFWWVSACSSVCQKLGPSYFEMA